MLRSMYSGISGMKNFQTKLDVIGNNIANVNTFGYKKSRVTFKDMASQTISGASGPGTTIGGTNGKQVGLGSSLGTIDMIMTNSSLQTTGNPTDLGIDGDGFFVVQDPANPANQFYTRAGNFKLDQNGTLVTGDGYKVLGKDGNEITISSNDYDSFSISKEGVISGIKKGEKDATEISTIQLATFNNPSGLVKQGNNLYGASANSGTPIPTEAGKGAGLIYAGTLEMSNVDLSEEFTEMIVTQRGFQANTRIITTSDQILEELVNLKR